jgi:class 3 adenylate cyclase/predicted ATPase
MAKLAPLQPLTLPGDVMNLADWLQSLGLERYVAAFRENEIDETVLTSLTAEDLEDLGVKVVGHRRKLLDAIALLRGNKTAKASSPLLSDKNAFPTDTAERRQVTVMFVDLVGSTELSARMDPEDLHAVISAYQKCVGETITRLGGLVANYMGDGVLVYFGYPTAHEDDAERAVRAALNSVNEVAALDLPVSLQARVGISTGLVVVGDLIRSDGAHEHNFVGETPNLAARLQLLAEPGAVVIAEGTRKLVGDLFELRDLGLRSLKGIAAPVPAWAVLRPSTIESRFEALHASGLTALVGRDQELEMLLQRWSQAKSSHGQVVLLSGEPGIGKSRLVGALTERLAGEPQARLRYFCSPQHIDSPFFPIIGRMERAAGFTREDTSADKLNKLGAMLLRNATSPHDASLFLEMLSLPNDGQYPVLDLTPQQRRERTLDALTAQLMSLTRRQIVLIILEDAHWSDPSTLEMLGRTVKIIATQPVLFVVTYRPEFEPTWTGQSHVTSLAINRLARREVDILIDKLAGDQPIAAGIRQDIMNRSDGVPLFVEEVTKAVLEAGSQTDPVQISSIPSSRFDVPATLQSSLLARLDRLGAAKEVAQIGASIGREFSYALLAAVAPQSEPELQLALNRLVAAGLLFQLGVPPRATYLFKHALVQDAASGTLLREPKRALHARIAAVMESHFPDLVRQHPELLAHHCTEATLVEKAASLWGSAGQRSLQRSALTEAAAQLSRALDQIATLPSTPALRAKQIELQVALINPLMHVKGYGAPETKAAAERARLLIEEASSRGEPPEDPQLLFSVLHGFAMVNLVTFNGKALRELAEQFLALAYAQSSTVPLMVGHRIMGHSRLFTGDVAESRIHYDRSIALYDDAKLPLVTGFGGVEARVSALCFRSQSLWMLGYPKSALADAVEAIGRSRAIGHAVTLINTLCLSGRTNILCGRYNAARAELTEGIALSDEKSALFWNAQAMASLGVVSTLAGDAAAAVKMIGAGISLWRSTGATASVPFFQSYLALAHAMLDQYDESWHNINQAMATIETTGERLWTAEVHRLAGEIALSSPCRDVAEAQARFMRAISVARQQQAKSWELRASISLARLWRDQDKAQQARELLDPVYDWFTEGFDTLDLKDAKELLEKLGGTHRSEAK